MLPRTPIPRLVILAGLTVILAVGHLLTPRYRVASGNLLQPAMDDPVLWSGATNQLSRLAAGCGGECAVKGLRLVNPSPSRRVVVRHRVAVDSVANRVGLSGRIRCDDLQLGKASWMGGRVTIRSLDDAGAVIPDDQKILCSRDGTTQWRHYALDYHPPEGAAAIIVMIQQLGTRGSIEVADLALVRLAPSAWFPYGQALWVMLWLVWAVLGVVWGFPGWRPGLLGVVAITLGILTLLLLPVGMVTRFPSHVAEWLRPHAATAESVAEPAIIVPLVVPIAAVVTEEGWRERIADRVERLRVEMLGHMGTFAILGFVLGWLYLGSGAPGGTLSPRFGLRLGSLLVAALLMATGFELVQRVTISRTVSLHDWIQNLKGMTLGILLSLVWHRGLLLLLRRRKQCDPVSRLRG